MAGEKKGEFEIARVGRVLIDGEMAGDDATANAIYSGALTSDVVVKDLAQRLSGATRRYFNSPKFAAKLEVTLEKTFDLYIEQYVEILGADDPGAGPQAAVAARIRELYPAAVERAAQEAVARALARVREEFGGILDAPAPTPKKGGE